MAEGPRNLRLLHHADGDAFSVEHRGHHDGLDAVAHGVAKVQNRAEAPLPLVQRDDVRLGGGDEGDVKIRV